MGRQHRTGACAENKLTRRSAILAGAAGAGLLLLPSRLRAGTSTITLESRQGKLQGLLSNGIRAFKGIPYGQPTGGASRFLPPKPAESWAGIRDATGMGPPSPQRNTDYSAWVDPVPGTEDCLRLNVWSREGADKLPVMVWIHGGGFASGSGGLPIYDGAAMARKGDVVVVTVNHRLNIFGYTYLGSEDPLFATSANVGQLDLVEALRWVRANIATFGGDADNVTIFGESGGGAKIGVLMAMPSARGLFHKAIVESGSSLDVGSIATGDETALAVYSTLGLRQGDVEGLQRVSTEKLLECYNVLSPGTVTGGGKSVYFGPVGDGIAVPEHTWTPFAPSASAGVPLLVGTNLDESVAFLAGQMYTPPADDQALAELVATFSLGHEVTVGRAKELVTFYRRRTPNASRLDLLVRITTDAGMWRSAYQQAERKAAQGAALTYVYEFDWKTPCFGGEWSLHGIEIPFIFGNLEYGVAWDGKDSEALRIAADPGGARIAVADQMLQVWTTFARTGNPSTPIVGTWAPYNKNDRQTMVLGKTPHLVSDLRGECRRELSKA